MGQSKPFDVELVLTDAALAVAAARQSGNKLDPFAAAERILSAKVTGKAADDQISAAISEIKTRLQ